MTLVCDYQRQIFVWVDEQDPSIELSPHFDYEEDAEQWYLTRSNKSPANDQ